MGKLQFSEYIQFHRMKRNFLFRFKTFICLVHESHKKCMAGRSLDSPVHTDYKKHHVYKVT